MKQLVIMPGGFHPFHAGHAALYNSAREAFPGADVYVAATNDTSTRPFPFAVKEKLAQLAGVAPRRFVQVKSPFRAEEIVHKFDPNNTQLIFVRSEKDSGSQPKPGGIKKDGSPSYLQPYNDSSDQPLSQQAYMAYLPTVEFGPGMTSATEIRGAWPKLNEKRKTALVMSLYPKTQSNPKLAATVVKLLDTAMGTELTEGPFVSRIIHPGNVDIFIRSGKDIRLAATNIPYSIVDKYIDKVIKKYPQFTPADFSFKASNPAQSVKENQGWAATLENTSLKPDAFAALQQAKQNIEQNRQQEIDQWAQDFQANTASKFAPRPRPTAPAPAPVAQPGEKHSVLKAKLAQLDQAIKKQQQLDALTQKLEYKGLLTPAMQQDLDTRMYVRGAAADNYQALNQKLDRALEIATNRLRINKLAFKEDADYIEEARKI